MDKESPTKYLRKALLIENLCSQFQQKLSSLPLCLLKYFFYDEM